MHQLKSSYNSPFKDSYSHPIHTRFAMIASNDSCHVGFRSIYFIVMRKWEEKLSKRSVYKVMSFWGNLFPATQPQELQQATKEIKSLHKFSREVKQPVADPGFS